MPDQRLTTVDSSPDPQIQRDRFGRPCIPNPDTGKTETFLRPSTLGSAVEDLYNVQRWERRMDAIGFSQRPDLVLAAAAASDNRKELDGICGQAKEAGLGSAASNRGTALHRLAERRDRGEALPIIPEQYRDDIAAYEHVVADWNWLAIEEFTVLDSHGLAGSPDRIGVCAHYPDEAFVVDLKTGSTVDLGAVKFAAQLAVYARSVPVDPVTGMRGQFSLPVSQQWGLIIHLPAGQGRPELRWIDLVAGWGVVETALDVRRWRKHKPFYRPYEPAGSPAFADEVAAASSVEALYDVWRRAEAAGLYTESLHRACVARKAEISESA